MDFVSVANVDLITVLWKPWKKPTTNKKHLSVLKRQENVQGIFKELAGGQNIKIGIKFDLWK